jgi:hypothetical protein
MQNQNTKQSLKQTAITESKQETSIQDNKKLLRRRGWYTKPSYTTTPHY